MTAPDNIRSTTGPSVLTEVGSLLDDGLLVADQDGAILSANSTAVRLLGEGLVGKTLMEVIDRDDIADVVAGRETSCTLSILRRPISR